MDTIDESLDTLRELPTPPLDELVLTLAEKGYVLMAMGAAPSSLKAFSEAKEILRNIDLRGVLVEADLFEWTLRTAVRGQSMPHWRST